MSGVSERESLSPKCDFRLVGEVILSSLLFGFAKNMGELEMRVIDGKRVLRDLYLDCWLCCVCTTFFLPWWWWVQLAELLPHLLMVRVMIFLDCCWLWCRCKRVMRAMEMEKPLPSFSRWDDGDFISLHLYSSLFPLWLLKQLVSLSLKLCSPYSFLSSSRCVVAMMVDGCFDLFPFSAN